MPTCFTKVPRMAASWLTRLLVLGAPLVLGACHPTDRIVATSPLPDDYRLVHPIALVDAPKSLDIFVADAAGGLDARTVRELRQFASDARAHGLSPVTVLLPAGSRHDAAARAAMPAIRHELVAAGARGSIVVGSYPIADAALASPIRLTVSLLQAKLESRCGQWPSDLASASSADGWDNRHYWNYGCATQNNFAAQVDDPRDLVAPRGDEPSDVKMRMRAIDAVRQGADPGTNWVVKNSNLGAAGG